eukprot:m.42046 g.42046  ORF g.42046 m.42046 type:complete len:93 (+) comp11509_c1_seq1:35-313(+)
MAKPLTRNDTHNTHTKKAHGSTATASKLIPMLHISSGNDKHLLQENCSKMSVATCSSLRATLSAFSTFLLSKPISISCLASVSLMGSAPPAA